VSSRKAAAELLDRLTGFRKQAFPWNLQISATKLDTEMAVLLSHHSKSGVYWNGGS